MFTAFGPNDGIVTLDGVAIAYSGLEPILLPTGLPNQVVFNLTSGDDVATLTQSGGTLTLSSGGTFELTSFLVPSGGPPTSLTINGGAGTDHVIISGPISLGTASLTINAELIDVPTAASIVTSGDVTLGGTAASNTDVAHSAAQVARVSVDGSITAGGHISLTASVGQTLALVGQTLTDDVNFALGSDSRAEVRQGAVISGATLLVRAETIVSFTYVGDAPPLTVFGLAGGASVNVAVTNVTHAGIASGATASVGGGPLSTSDPASVAIEATDDTSVSILVTDTSTPSTAAAALDQLLNFLTFDRIGASTAVTWDTRAFVGDLAGTGDILSTPGTARVTAENTGTLESEIVSDFVGAAQNTISRDDAVAAIVGAGIDVGGLELPPARRASTPLRRRTSSTTSAV